MNTLKKSIDNGNFKNLYIFHGSEDYLKTFYKDYLINKVMDDTSKMMNFDSFEGANCSIKKIVDAYTTLPFLSERRIVCVENSDIFYKRNKADSDFFYDNIEHIPETSIVIFVESRIDKRSRAYKKAVKNAYLLEFKTPSDDDLVVWIKKRLKENNKTIDSPTALYLLRYTAHDMTSVSNEIKKLIDYKKEENITFHDINEICTKALETKIFDLINAVGNKKTDIALNIYNNLIVMKEPPLKILSLLTMQFRRMLQTRQLMSESLNRQEIANALKIRSFAVNEYITQGKNFPSEVLMRAIHECLECDVNIKTGKIRDILALELLIIKYSS